MGEKDIAPGFYVYASSTCLDEPGPPPAPTAIVTVLPCPGYAFYCGLKAKPPFGLKGLAGYFYKPAAPLLLTGDVTALRAPFFAMLVCKRAFCIGLKPPDFPPDVLVR